MSTIYASTAQQVIGQPPPLQQQPTHAQWQWQAWQAELHAQTVRAKVATRLELVSLKHAEHAWALRNSFGIAATATALLFLDPGNEWRVAVAGKLFPDSEQVADPGRVLLDVCHRAREVIAAGLDVRVEMSENPDPMTSQAFLAGVAVSLLDTPSGTWREVRGRNAGGALHIPGRVLALLIDDTMLLADRVERHHPEYYHVAGSAHIDRSLQRIGRRFAYHPQLTTLDDASTRPLWLRLAQLRHVLAGGEL